MAFPVYSGVPNVFVVDTVIEPVPVNQDFASISTYVNTSLGPYIDAQIATLVPATRLLTAGTGLTGGGDLSADRTFNLADTAVVPGSYPYVSIDVDQQGRITLATGGVTPPPETRNLTAGTGLSGGGDLTADRTFNLANTAVVAGTYTNPTVDIDAQGRITAAANGTGPGTAALFTLNTDLRNADFAPANSDSFFMVDVTGGMVTATFANGGYGGGEMMLFSRYIQPAGVFSDLVLQSDAANMICAADGDIGAAAASYTLTNKQCWIINVKHNPTFIANSVAWLVLSDL